MIRTLNPSTESMGSFFKLFEKDSTFIKVDIDYSNNTYKRFVDEGIGQVFLACNDDTGEVVGGLGCVKFKDLHSGELTAVETFWYVAPEYRHTLHGVMLLDTFEQWAKDSGCTRIAMIHLADSMPDALSRLYVKRGYKLLELHYIKEV